MKTMRLLVISLLLCSVGLSESYNPPKRQGISTSKMHVHIVQKKSVDSIDIDEEFWPYIASLKAKYLQINGEALTIEKLSIHRGELHAVLFGTTPDAIGECHQETKNIIIGSWGRLDDWQREELIFHEVGHCVFGMTHEWGGLMAPEVHKREDYVLNRDGYMKHFFQSAKKLVQWQKGRSLLSFLPEEFEGSSEEW